MTRRRSQSSASLRPIGMPRVLEVHADDEGRPLVMVRVDTHGRRYGEARVERIEERWRLSEAWWREAPQARTYYRVVLDGGQLFTVYRDDVTGRWYEQPYTEPLAP